MHLLLPHKTKTQTSIGYKQQQNQATSLLGTAATFGARNCFYSGHWMSLHCKGTRILQWNCFWWLPWLNWFLIPYKHFHIHNLPYGFFGDFFFICLESLVVALVLLCFFSFLPDECPSDLQWSRFLPLSFLHHSPILFCSQTCNKWTL